MKTIEIKYNVDTGEAVKNVDKLNESIEETNQEAEKSQESFGGILGVLDQVSGGAVTGFRNMVGGIKSATMGFKGLRAAVISTGIGALVVAIVALVSWFTKTEKGARLLQTATAALGIIFNRITDNAAKLGEALYNAFNDPQQAVDDLWNKIKENIINRIDGIIQQFTALGKVIEGALDLDWDKVKEGAMEYGEGVLMMATGLEDPINDITNGFNDLVEEINDAVDQADRYARSVQNTRKIIRQYIVDNAELNAEIETQQKIIDDTTRSFEERTAALDAQNIATEQLAENVANQAKAEESLLRQKIALASTYEEEQDLQDELAQKVAERIEAEKALQIVRLENAQKTREINLEEFERQKSIQDMINDLRIQNIEDEKEAALAQLELDEQNAMRELELLRATEEEKQAVRDYYAQLRKTAREEEAEEVTELEENRLELAQMVASGITEIAETFSKGEGERAKRSFNIAKALGIAEATINTYAAITDALAKDSVTPFSRYVSAAMAGAMGLAQVIQISQTQFGGGTTPSVGGGGAGMGASAEAASTAPSIDFGFLTQGANQGSVQAYVIGQDVTNQQQADQLVADQSRL